MRGAREAVVAHNTIGDEIAATGADVDQVPHPDRFDRDDLEPRLRLDRTTVERELVRDRGVDKIEETLLADDPTADRNGRHADRVRPFAHAKLVSAT